MKVNQVIIAILFSFLLNGCVSDTTLKKDNIPASVELEVIQLIPLEGNSNFPSAFSVLNLSPDSAIIAGQDRRNNSLLFYDFDGSLKNTLNIPTIDNPVGINSISGSFAINSDSLLVYDGSFLRLILMNSTGDVIDYWKISDFWNGGSRSGNVGIVDSYLLENDLIVELEAFEKYFPINDKRFYENSNLLHRINLTEKTVESGINYPRESVYREQLFYQGFSPSIVKAENSYLLTLPFDKNIYRYTADFKSYSLIDNSAKGFPKGTGQPFGSRQVGNNARISRKLNGFGLKIKQPVYVDGLGACVIRVYREAMGDSDAIPDGSSFSPLEFPPKFNLELFQLTETGLVKVGSEISLSEGKMGNYIGQDLKGYLYFLEYNNNVEDPRIIKTRLIVKKD